MNWLDTQMALLDVATGAVEIAVNWLLQSTLLIAAGLTIGRLLRMRGSAVQSVVYRTTLAAVLICPLATWGLSLAEVGVTLNGDGTLCECRNRWTMDGPMSLAATPVDSDRIRGS